MIPTPSQAANLAQTVGTVFGLTAAEWTAYSAIGTIVAAAGTVLAVIFTAIAARAASRSATETAKTVRAQLVETLLAECYGGAMNDALDGIRTYRQGLTGKQFMDSFEEMKRRSDGAGKLTLEEDYEYVSGYMRKVYILWRVQRFLTDDDALAVTTVEQAFVYVDLCQKIEFMLTRPYDETPYVVFNWLHGLPAAGRRWAMPRFVWDGGPDPADEVYNRPET